MKIPPRRQARILGFQILYSRSHLGLSYAGELALCKASGLKEDGQDFALALAEKAWEARPQLDPLISGALKEWRQDRLTGSLNALLRLALTELLFWPETDGKVILNETVEIAKLHLDKAAIPLLNGVLHSLAQAGNRLP